MTRTKTQIARARYHCPLSACTSGEKAQVTKIFNAQTASAPVVSRRNTFKCYVGRADVNGTQSCIISKGKTVAELLEQAKYAIDEDKEAVTMLSSGEQVDLNEKIVNNETYVIAPAIESAY